VQVRIIDHLLQIQDLNSSNGTFVEDVLLSPMNFYNVNDNSTISFGPAKTKIRLKLYVLSEEANEQVQYAEKQAQNEPIKVNLSAFAKNDQDIKVSFKNVGLRVPEYKNPSAHAQEIIKEAEFIKNSMIKSVDVYKARSINETRIQAEQATQEAYEKYQKLVEALLDETKRALTRSQTETEAMLNDKRLQANEEIQNLWTEHRNLIQKEKEKQFEKIEKENLVKLELSIEKMKSDMFFEKNRLITDAENEILRKKRSYQVEFETEKNEHESRLKLYKDELTKIELKLSECEEAHKKNKVLKDDSEIELHKVMSQLKHEKENLEFVKKQHHDTLELHNSMQEETARFDKLKVEWEQNKLKAEKELEELKRNYGLISEKKDQAEEQLNQLNLAGNQAKVNAKQDVEKEYKNLRDLESKKFNDYKANELKELQKIRDEHGNAVKRFSVDLSQEIATKIELLAKKSGASFDFEKNFELINSVIQVKSSLTTGSESKHTQQLDDWKKRKKSENASFIMRGFVAGLICVFVGNYAYRRLSVDPVKEQLARIALERKESDLQNAFVPTKTNTYYDEYVGATLYTENFSTTYLDESVQREWVSHAIKYFLRQWQVDEEKVVQVISNSKALVQTIDEKIPTLKKDRLKSDLAKLKELEDANIIKQADILGSTVRYEAYKKLEKKFFTERIQNRLPANSK
ncbi:MAG: FHA domain-containing protein, partial [Bdellovibrionota bacterium]